MKRSLNVRQLFLTVLLVVGAIALQVFGGHPVWPPAKHSAEYRQANMLFLRFQDDLAAERWQDALSLCSARVRAKASEWPSPKVFFNETMPVDLLLTQDFGYWSVRSDRPAASGWTENATFYGLFVPLTDPKSEPAIQWHWAIAVTNQTWVVDYPPLKLEEFIARSKAAIQEREDKTKQIRQSLEPSVKAIKTRLSAVTERFRIGSPMLFRLELTNVGEKPVHYVDSGVAFTELKLLDDKKQPLSGMQVPMQIMVRRGDVAPGKSVVLSEKIDLNLHYQVTTPGTYFVQFSGQDLAIGEPVPQQDFGPFGENEIGSGEDFEAATNTFPSNVIRIDVTATDKR